MKKCSYLRIRVTNLCNLKCAWCHNEGGIVQHNGQLSVGELEKAVRLLTNFGFKKIKLAGGEPTARKDLVELVRALSKIPGAELSMISNGTLLTDKLIKNLKLAGLTRINLSINTLVEENYKLLQGGTRNQLRKMLSSIELLLKLGMEKPKINFLYLGPQSDSDLLGLMHYTKQFKLSIAILNVLPGYGTSQFTYLPTAHLIDKILHMGVKDIFCESDPNSFSTMSFAMKDGAVLEIGHHLLGQEFVYKSCAVCPVRALCLETVYSHRLTPDGLLQPCLLRHDNCFDLKPYLESRDNSEVTVSKLKTYFRRL